MMEAGAWQGWDPRALQHPFRGTTGRGSPHCPPADEGPQLRRTGRRISMQEWSPLTNKLA